MNAKEFGEYLKSLRREKKLTIRQLDLYSGVSNSYISQMERGARGIPSPDILKKLAKPLGVSYEELMSKSGYFDSEDGKFEDLLYKVFRFFLNYMNGNEFEKAVHQLLKEQGYDNEYIKRVDIKNYDYEGLYKHIEFPDRIAFLHIFLDMYLTEEGEMKSEEEINDKISKKYSSLTGKKREMADNFIDMLYSDK